MSYMPGPGMLRLALGGDLEFRLQVVGFGNVALSPGGWIQFLGSRVEGCFA